MKGKEPMSPLRPFRLSTDLRVCVDVLPRAFRYPENPAWDMQPDEAQELVEMLALDPVRPASRPTAAVERLSPGRRIALSVPQWQGAVVKAARETGFVERLTYRCMGRVL